MFSLVLSLGMMLASSNNAHAYISVRSQQGGAVVHWSQGSQLTFRLNPTNSSGMSPDNIFSIFTTSLSRWKQAALDGFSFNYYQGTDTSRYPNYVGGGIDNDVFFTSNGSQSDQLQCGVIALTQVWYDSGSGVASKADMRFNDKCYQFTMNQPDTRTQQKIYFGDVVTHELGHALGLDHSENMQSSMIYTAAINMSKPSCDDHAAMVGIYGLSGHNQTGTLSGHIYAPNGAQVFGAHVSAIELERGIVMASGLTDKDGSFHIAGIEPGHYTIVAEPYYPGSSPLGPYYSGISAAVCSGANFERTFARNGGLLSSVNISAGGSNDIGNITVSCAQPASINSSAENSASTAPVLTAQSISEPIATQGTLRNGTHQYFKLQNQVGHLEANAMAYSLFSPVDTYIEFLNANGTAISQNASIDDVFSSSLSGFVNFDSKASIDLNSRQDVYVHVYSLGSVPNTYFPSQSQGVSATPYYVLTISSGAAPSSLFANNARCETPDSFTAFASQGEAPALGQKDDQSKDSAAGCGSISDYDGSSGGSGGSGGGPVSQVRVLNFALLAAMLVGIRKRLLAPASQR